MNANYIYNVLYSEAAAEISDKENGKSSTEKVGMSNTNITFLRDINKAIDIALYQKEQDAKEKEEYLNYSFKVEGIKMKTCYPGVLIGTGSAHETGALNEMILGFTFDYVTGIPYLPGSSLKGLLRSAFKFGKNKTEYVKDFLQKEYREKFYSIDDEAVKDLENKLFENPDSGIIFFDSYMLGLDADVSENEVYMGIDYLTPHKDEPLKNPTPLPMLRINPNVVFNFRFHLHNITITNASKQDILIEVAVIKKLFSMVLIDFGIGAKTNVGYGTLRPFNGKLKKHEPKWENSVVVNEQHSKRQENYSDVRAKTGQNDHKENNKNGQFRVGDIIVGKVTNTTNYGVFVDLGGGKSGMVYIKNTPNGSTEEFSRKDTVKVKIIGFKSNDRIDLTMKGVR